MNKCNWDNPEYRFRLILKGFFVGQGMKEMKGKGDPMMINDIIEEKLNNYEN